VEHASDVCAFVSEEEVIIVRESAIISGQVLYDKH